MIDLRYSLVIEATSEPDFFSFYSPDLEGFSGVGHSVEDCLYQAKAVRNSIVTLGRGSRHVPPPAGGPPGAAVAHCRSETSSRIRKGHLPLHGRSCGEAQALANIFRLEIRVFGENLTLRHPARQ